MKLFKTMIPVFLAVSALIGGSFIPTGQHANTHVDEKPAIVLDLGGVVFDTSRLKFVYYELGPYALLSRNLKRRWYNALQQIAEENGSSFKPCDSSGNPVVITDHEGDQIPQFMAEWMCGHRSGAEIRNEIITNIKKHPERFSKWSRKPLICMTRAVFTPERFVSSRKRLEATIKMAKKLKKKGYPIYILSNWDSESFALMREKHADFFDILDGYVISGDVHTAKPSPDIYELFMQKYPHQCYCFIDDQKDNIDAASSCGWHTIKTMTKHPDIDHISEKITALSSPIAEEHTA